MSARIRTRSLRCARRRILGDRIGIGCLARLCRCIRRRMLGCSFVDPKSYRRTSIRCRTSIRIREGPGSSLARRIFEGKKEREKEAKKNTMSSSSLPSCRVDPAQLPRHAHPHPPNFCLPSIRETTVRAELCFLYIVKVGKLSDF